MVVEQAHIAILTKARRDVERLAVNEDFAGHDA